MAKDRLDTDVRRKIEKHADATGPQEPPIPPATFVLRPLSNEVRTLIEKAHAPS